MSGGFWADPPREMATRLEEDDEFPSCAEDFAEDALEAFDVGEAERPLEDADAGEGERDFEDARDDDADEDLEDVDSSESDSESDVSDSEADASLSSDADSDWDADDSESEDEESDELLLEVLLAGDADLETSLSSGSGTVGAICGFEADCFFIGEMDRLFDTSGLFRAVSTFSSTESTSIFSSESDSSRDSSLTSLSLSSGSSLLSDDELADEEVSDVSMSSSVSCEEADREVGDEASSSETDNFEPDLVSLFPLTVTTGVGFFLISLMSRVVDAFGFTETALSSAEALAFLDGGALIGAAVVGTAVVAGWIDEESSAASVFDCAFLFVVCFFATFSGSGSATEAGSFSFPFSPLLSGELLIVCDFFSPPAGVKMTTSGLAFGGDFSASTCIASSLSSDASTPFPGPRSLVFGSGAFVDKALCFLSLSGVSGILESSSSEVSGALSDFLGRALFFPG